MTKARDIASMLTSTQTLSNKTFVAPALGTPASGTLTNASFPTGHVLQVINSQSVPVTTSTASTDFQDTGHSVTITPSSTASKILLSWSHVMFAATNEVHISFFRDSTNLGRNIGNAFSQATNVWIGATMSYLDSPSTTSSITYKVKFKSNSGSVTVYGVHGDVNASLTAMEVQG